MKLLLIVLAIFVHTCHAFVLPVESLKISSAPMNGRWGMRRAAELAGMSMAKATKEDTAKV